MSNKQTYEEANREQLDELSLPDSEQSWQRMKQLLEDTDDRDPVVPPAFVKSCAGWGLLLIGLIAATWLVIHQKKAPVLARHTKTEEQKRPLSQEKSPPVNKGGSPATEVVLGPETTLQGKEKPGEKKEPNALVSKSFEKNISDKEAHAAATVMPAGKNKQVKRKAESQYNALPLAGPMPAAAKNGVRYFIPLPFDFSRKATGYVPASTAAGAVKVVVRNDSVTVGQASSALKGKKKKPQFWWSFGLGMQQQIPLGGQGTTAYTYKGNKNTLVDYIPSLYLRLHKGQQWFVQGEFQYGTPQSVNNFSFSQRTQYNAAANTSVTTTDQLEKTYYHQLILSFNYDVRPNWSIGLGGAYSRFHGAVTEEETKATNVQTGAQTIARLVKPIEGFTDSFLYKTQVHVLLQTEYQWKRFSAGLRYLKDIQPYIKYTKPSGDIHTEKNQALELVVRYRLWMSKRAGASGKGR